jgi:hypothetical protein
LVSEAPNFSPNPRQRLTGRAQRQVELDRIDLLGDGGQRLK